MEYRSKFNQPDDFPDIPRVGTAVSYYIPGRGEGDGFSGTGIIIGYLDTPHNKDNEWRGFSLPVVADDTVLGAPMNIAHITPVGWELGNNGYALRERYEEQCPGKLIPFDEM